MSNLLSQASLVMIPSGYKEDTVYSAIPTDGSGDLSFTRASNGTRVNSAGLVEVVAWNLASYSEEFSNAVWNKSNVTITSNDTTAPNGTLTADKIAQTSGGYVNGNATGTGGNTYVFSVYLKAGSVSSIRLRESYYYGTSSTFNLSAGTASGTGIIESVGNGWFRCSLPQTYLAGEVNLAFIIDITTVGNYYAWGAQLNIGSTAKPYFPTTDRLNVPRLTYQNGGGGCPSLLLEKQSTNLVTYSEEFDNAAWTKNVSVTANAIISPDGTQNADKILESSSNVAQWAYQSFAMSGAQTATIYAKKGERNYIALATAGLDFSYFNLDTGVVVSTASGATTSIQNAGNGWYRCSVNASTPTSSFFIVAISDNGTQYSYAGDTSKGVYVWGAQNEASSYPTSYIPTTSSSATRVADVCSKTGISSLIGQTEGVAFIDFDFNGNYSSGGIIPFSLDGGAGSELYAWIQTNGTVIFEVYNSFVGQVVISGSIGAVGRKKIAFAYKQNDFAVYLNGVQVGTDTSGTVPTMSRLFVGRYYANETYNINAGINQFELFPTRLTNAELASLTTI